MYDEVDLQLVNLLQIDPRIPWAHAEQILQLSATTLSRRWARLSGDGLAWIATYPSLNAQYAAFVEVDCRADRLSDVVRDLSAHRMVVSIEECTGNRDLLLTVFAPDLPTLTMLVVDWIAGLDGVLGVRSSLITKIHLEGSSWRMNALDQRQSRDAAAHLVPPDPGRAISAGDLTLVEELAKDGRASVASLAQAMDAPPSTVHRRLQRLLASRQVTMRCDVAPELSGWQLEWSWYASVPPSHTQRVVEFLKSQRDLRMCASITGPSNLVFTFRSTSLAGLADFESAVAATLPGLAPAETIVHLRSRKRMGWLLDTRGRAADPPVVPVFGA